MSEARERSGYCRYCKRRVLAREKQFNALGHAGLCVFTLGLWIPFALVFAILHGLRNTYLCPRCGSPTRRA